MDFEVVIYIYYMWDVIIAAIDSKECEKILNNILLLQYTLTKQECEKIHPKSSCINMSNISDAIRNLIMLVFVGRNTCVNLRHVVCGTRN